MANPHRRRRRNPARRRRGGTAVVMVNPRRQRRRRNPFFSKKRRHHQRRRRNPGGFITQVLSAAVPAAVTGLALGFIDAKLLSKFSAVVRIGAKLAVLVAGGYVFRKQPEIRGPLMGSIVGSITYEQGMTFGGGTVGAGVPAAQQAISALIREDPRAMGILVREMRGMGLHLDTQSRISGTTEGSNTTALPSYAFEGAA